MARGQKIGRISKEVRDLVRDRLNDRIDDSGFKHGLSNVIETNKGIGNLYSDIGEALAKWVTNYFYLITDEIDANLARGLELEWAIVMKWGRGELRDDSIKKLCYSRLQSTQNKESFKQRLTDLIHERQGMAGYIEKLREEVTRSVLDYFFDLADLVNDRIRQDFHRYHVVPMSK